MAHPNPLRNETTIRFSAPRNRLVDVSVYDVRGRLVRPFPTRVSTGEMNRLTWASRNQEGEPVASGIYYLLVKGETAVERKALIVLRWEAPRARPGPIARAGAGHGPERRIPRFGGGGPV